MHLFITDSGDFTRSALVDALSEMHDLKLEEHSTDGTTPWSDPDQLASQLDDIDCVVHFTRPVPVRYADAQEKWRIVAGTENLLNAALATGVRRFILISTADVCLHRAERVNWNEVREPPREKVVGASAKLARLAEEIALGFNLRGLETITLRPASLWGPGMPDPRCEAERRDRRGLRLVGSGENFIATTHIDNLVRAVSLAVQTDGDGVGHSYYICDNEMLDSATFFGEVSRVLGLPEPEPGPGRRIAYLRGTIEELRRGPDLWRADVIRRGYGSAFDTLSAHKHLKWSPAVDFQTGIESMVPELKLVKGSA